MFKRQTLQLHSVAPDLIPQDAPKDVWNSGQNVFFRNGETCRALGDTATLNDARTPLTMCFTRNRNEAYWVYATETGIYAHDGTNEYDITPAGGWSGVASPETVWTSCVLNGIACINASDRDPVYWGGNIASPCELLPDWPTGGRCYALRAHKNFLFAIGMFSEGPERIRWSDAAETGTVPQEWEPAADNQAGFLDLSPLSSPCLDGKTMRDDFMVYKGESIWALSYIGGQFVFASRKVFSEAGVAATNAITGGPNDEHMFAGSDGDVYLTNGVQHSSVLDGRAQRTYYQDFSAEWPRIFSAVYLAREKLGVLIYPAASQQEGNLALLYDYASGDIGNRQMPDVLCACEGQALLDVGDLNTWDGSAVSWDTEEGSWNYVYAAQSVDDVLIGGAFGFRVISSADADNFADQPVSALVEKRGLAFGTADRGKLVKSIWPRIVGRTGDQIRFRVGGQQILAGPVQWSPPVNYVIGTPEPIDTFAQGRFLALEIASVGGMPWRFGSFDVVFRETGKW